MKELVARPQYDAIHENTWFAKGVLKKQSATRLWISVFWCFNPEDFHSVSDIRFSYLQPF